MKITQLILGVAGLMTVGAAVFSVQEFRVAGAATEARVAANRRSAEVRTKIADLESKLMAEGQRAQAVEGDNAALAMAVQQAQSALEKPGAVAITREGWTERVKRAVALGKDGDAEAARRELLWCYDTAVAQPALVAGSQMISIVSGLMKLSERHPGVLADLRERFEAGKRRVLQGDDTEPLSVMGMIARALKDDQAMVSVFDALPAGGPGRTLAGLQAVEGLIAAKRYADVLAVQGYGTMSSVFESATEVVTASWSAGAVSMKMSERGKAAGRSYAVTSAAKNIEVLAGAGDLTHARELAGRLLAFDGSEATRALLQKHLERAGKAELLSAGAGK